MKKRVFPIIAALAVLAGAFALWIGKEQKKYTSTGFAMGSVLTQTWWRRDHADFVLEKMQQTEKWISELTEAPPLAVEIMEASGGAYNPYLGALARLWNIDSKDGSPPYVPTQEEIGEALQKRELDLGAYGKGAACETLIYTIFEFSSHGSAVINLGGNIHTYGQKPWWQPFKISLRDPMGSPNDMLGLFTLKGTHFISTSGSYEKYFEQDGVRYHHIFDPETGYPTQREPGLASVTVVTRAGGQPKQPGATGDMISTACFVLGYENSLDLLEKYACDAIFVYENGEVRAAGAVLDYFEITNAAYRIGARP